MTIAFVPNFFSNQLCLMRSSLNQNFRELLSHGIRSRLSVSFNGRGFASGPERIVFGLINRQDWPCGHPSTKTSNFALHAHFCGVHVPTSTDTTRYLTFFIPANCNPDVLLVERSDGREHGYDLQQGRVLKHTSETSHSESSDQVWGRQVIILFSRHRPLPCHTNPTKCCCIAAVRGERGEGYFEVTEISSE